MNLGLSIVLEMSGMRTIKKISTKSILNSDIVWIIAPWSIKSSTQKLKNKKVVCTIHH